MAASRLASAQQSLRPSLSSPQNQERQQFAATGYDYNLKLGPAFLSLGTTLGLEYNDNINLGNEHNTGESAPKPDFIYRPAIRLNAIYPVTKLNVLTLDLGLGVTRYTSNPDFNQTNVFISPNTQLSFDVYVGNVRFNLHDSLSVQQNAATRADTANSGPYSETTNTVGVSALWDLNKTILQAGYDYQIHRYTGTTYQNKGSGSHIFNGSIAFPLAATLTAGVQANMILTTYLEKTRPDVTSTSVGPFLQISPTRYTSVQLSGGYQRSTFKSKDSSNPDQQPFFFQASDSNQQGGSFYYSLSLQNRLNNYYQQSLTISSERQLSFETNQLETQSFRYDAQWQVNSRISLGANIFYQILRQDSALTQEKYNYYGWGLSFGYQLTRRLTAGFHYTHTQRASDLPFNDYSQNIVGLDFSYAF